MVGTLGGYRPGGNYVRPGPFGPGKQFYIDKKMEQFKWVLLQVIKDHGHTISLLEAALIAESMPDRYDYRAYLESIEDQVIIDEVYRT